MQATLEQSERERLQALYSEIATLAGGLAHEIRNPISTMGLYLELLGEELDVESSARDRRMQSKIERVQQECRNLEGILNAFLQFARVGELDLDATHLNELVRDFIEFYKPQAAEHRIEISPHLAADLPVVSLDRSLLRQVLLNLALNAQEAMPEGGLLELQTYLRDGQVHLDLIDNGAGMGEATRGKMFQAFFSTRPGGSGLGLPTVRKIVEAHGGHISCESEVGRGTRFTLSFPLSE